MLERIVVTEPFLRVGCQLGESPIFYHSTSTLHFIDIIQKKVFHLDTTTHSLTSDTFPEAVTGLALCRGGGLACTVESGFAVIECGKLKHLAQPIRPENRPYSRFNDGACDSRGRFFAGTMFSPEHNIPGLLYRYDPRDNSCVVVDEGFTHSNGIGWTADEHILFFTCSLTNVIYAYDYDEGTISNKRIFSDTSVDSAWKASKPDGLCMDDEGCIWSARWDGSAVVRLDKNGKVNLVIDIPSVLRVTACCFGGPNSDKLYITTASAEIYGGDSEQQRKYPDSGHLFMYDFAGRFKGVMKHGNAFRKLSRDSSHRDLMLRNLVTDLFKHEQIKTTVAKAKETARLAEKMITLGKKGDVLAYQRARSFLLNTAVARKVFTDFAPRYRTRPGGYTRIHKFGNRPGDNAPHAIIELVDNPRDLKFEMTARAVGWDLLAKKVRQSSMEEVAANGVKGVSWAVKEGRRQGLDGPALLRPLTRWNLQKTLRYRAPADRVELEKKAADHINTLLAKEVHANARAPATSNPEAHEYFLNMKNLRLRSGEVTPGSGKTSALRKAQGALAKYPGRKFSLLRKKPGLDSGTMTSALAVS
ncbi:unnamed protein product [Peniophora sp. CBMAI 1063]|nr:unnamed protein product [Peniophora sp. CBMAI 1063]